VDVLGFLEIRRRKVRVERKEKILIILGGMWHLDMVFFKCIIMFWQMNAMGLLYKKLPCPVLNLNFALRLELLRNHLCF
jgi:hypothetical protein